MEEKTTAEERAFERKKTNGTERVKDVEKTGKSKRANISKKTMNRERDMNNREYETERLKKMLIYHDWFYEYSDDHRAFMAGKASFDAIQAKAKALGREDLITVSHETFLANENVEKALEGL